MITTIKDIKLSAFKKIDPQIKDVTSTRITQDYINGFPSALNRGLQDLATAGKYVIKDIHIVQDNIVNILDMPLYLMDIQQHLKSDIVYKSKATAYYFEVSGTASIVFYINEIEVLRIENIEKGFTPYKGMIENPLLEEVTMSFEGDYPYSIRNIAMYDQMFETDEDVWEYVSDKRYNLKEMKPDFFKLAENDIVYQGDFSTTVYEKTEDYRFEGASTLVLNGLKFGEWIVHYYSYPDYIPEDVADDFELDLDAEIRELLIIYISSELVYDDDRSSSGAWRNHYEAGKALLQAPATYSKSVFIDSQGW